MSSIFWRSIRRWNLKFILFSFFLSYVLYCTIFNMPWFSSKLPQYSGEYDVGVVDIEAPVESHRRIGDFVFTENDQPAFQIETVLFSLYYPTERGAKGRKEKHTWVPKPLALHAEGYARFAKINTWPTRKLFTFGLWMLGGKNVVPAEVDAEILSTSQLPPRKGASSDSLSEEDVLTKFPVIVFSHGMASARTSYTQYCGELASRGYVVAAIEHRDGSGPGSVVMRKDGTSNLVFHFDAHSLRPRPDTPTLKRMQLDMRQVEVEETMRVLRTINMGKGQVIFHQNPRSEGSTLSDWEGRLDLDQVLMGGHSYGATLALQALKGSPSKALPFKGGMILDPGKQSGPLNHDIDVPIAIIHSQSWSAKHTIFHGRPHFNVVKDLAQGVLDRNISAWFMTAKGTTHPSVTDAPLIQPMLLSWTTGATIDVREGVQQYVRVTQDFVEFMKTSQRNGILTSAVSHPEYNKELRPVEGAQWARQWQVHVAP